MKEMVIENQGQKMYMGVGHLVMPESKETIKDKSVQSSQNPLNNWPVLSGNVKVTKDRD